MNTTHYSEYTQGEKMKFRLSDVIIMSMQSMDKFISYLKSKNPESVSALTKAYESKLDDEMKNEENTTDSALYNSLIAGCTNESAYENVYKKTCGLLVNLLDFKSDMMNKEVGIELEKFHKARLIPAYLRLCALCETLDRNNAIEIMKNYIDENIKSLPSRPDEPDDLMKFMDMQHSFNLQCQDMCWTNCIISEHKYVNKVSKCKVHELLKHYGDKELMEVVACYLDFAMITKTNENFKMTRIQTLIGGGSCCDTCYHDTRYLDSIEHPSNGFFDNLKDM